jgi:hypothetical protein
MKVFITIKLTILALLLAFNVYSQPNPDFDPHGVKLILPSHRMGIDAGDLVTIWDTIKTTPLAYSRSASAFITLNGVNYIYQFGGGVDTQLTMVARYSFADGTWSTNFARIPSGMSGATAITIGTDIYLFGGEFISGLGKTYKYDAVNNIWYAKANMLTPITDAAVINYNDNLIYVIGGGNGLFGTQEPYSNAVQVYNVSFNSYSTATNYPITAGMMGCGIWKDTIICAGGYLTYSSNPLIGKAVDTVFRGIINKNNPSQITWSGSKYPKYPAGPVTRPSSVSIRFANAVGVLFAGGAGNGVNALFNAYYWDFNLLMWRNLPDMMMAKCNSKAVFSGDSVAYMIAGYSNLPTGRNDKITFRKIEGISNSLNDFHLRFPGNNSTVTSVIGSSLPVLFSWDSSGTGAIYKWSFEKNGFQNTRLDTVVVGLNVFKITENDLDKFLASKLNMNQGDSVVGKWYVYAYKGPGAPGTRDSIPSDTLNVTFKRFKPTLSTFNLVTPFDGSKLYTSKSFVYPINFIWTKAASYGTTYKMYYTDSARNKQLVLQSSNSGTDTIFSIQNKILDSLLEKVVNVARGDSSIGKWKVYAYTGNDSLVSAQTFNLTLKRTLNEVAPFTILLPVDSTVISVSNFTTLNFYWTTSAIGATYKWQFSTNATFTSVVNLPSNNSGYDTALTVQTSDLIQLLGITAGGTVTGFWRAYAYKGTDSLPTTNKFFIKFTSQGDQQLVQKFPMSESFPPPNWNLQYTGTSRWEKSTYTSPFPLPYDTTTTGCAKYDFFSSPTGTQQALITNIFYPTRGEPGSGTAIKFDTLMFDYAHAYFGEANIDSLLIFSSSSDNGPITDTLIFLASNPNFNNIKSLSTVTYQNGPYTPSASDWRTKKVGLPTGTRRIKFVAKSGWGNNLYIDNIRVRDKSPEVVGITTGTAHTEIFRWYASNVPGSVYFLQITTVSDTNFLTGFKSGPLTAPVGGTGTYTTTPSDINLIAYTSYQFRMKTFNAADSSTWSAVSTFKRDSISILKQSFADTLFPPIPWAVSINGDTIPPLATYWSRAIVGGNPLTNTAAKFDFWNAPYGKLRSLISNSFLGRYVQQSTNDTVYFDIAHAYKNSVNIDTLFIYASTNYGTSWSTNPIRTLVSSQIFNDSTLSTTTSTTEFTPSLASHWKTLKFTISVPVNKIKFVCLSTNGNNMYITNLRLGSDPNGGLLTLNEPPTKYALNFNYPNPFNPTTTISYAIPKTSLTKLIIYDILGREITKLVNEVKNPGIYSVTFNATSYASGVYFYRLESGDFVDVKKMLLIK